MRRPTLEVADIFRQHGAAYREACTLPLEQLSVMRAIEICRTATLGGHVETCGHCTYTRNAYNSCRNRHCPKCQGSERLQWLQNRQEDLLAVEYFHVVFTLPEPAAQIAFHNKEVVYNILFRAAAETLLTIAADPRHLGAGIGFFAVLIPGGRIFFTTLTQRVPSKMASLLEAVSVLTCIASFPAADSPPIMNAGSGVCPASFCP